MPGMVIGRAIHYQNTCLTPQSSAVRRCCTAGLVRHVTCLGACAYALMLAVSVALREETDKSLKNLAQTTSTADTSLLQPCGSVSTAGKCASKDVARSRLSVCTALDSPHSPKTAAVGSPSPWSRAESPGLFLLSCTAPAERAGSALAEIAATEAADAAEAVAVSTLQLKHPKSAAHSRSSYALVHSELLAASSTKNLLATASPKPSSDRSSFLNSPSRDKSSSADLRGAAAGALDELLSGKISRARTSLFAASAVAGSDRSSLTVAAATGGAAGAAAVAAQRDSSIVVGSSNQIVERSVDTATAAARLSLAHVGLLAAPGAGLLPGSPLADASAAGSAAAAAMFGSSAGPGRHSAAGSRQQTHQQSRSVAAAALCVSVTGGVGGTVSERPQQQQPFLLDTSRNGAMCKSLSGNAALPGSLLQHQQHQQPDTTGSGQTAAAVHSSGSKKTTQQKQKQEAAAAVAQPAGSNDDSSSHLRTQLGTAAFRATSRAQANRVGRIKVVPSDAPGPAHYWPHHMLTDKHVPAAHIVLPSSSRPASPSRITAVAADANTASMARRMSTRATQHEQQQQQQEQGRQTPTTTGLTIGAKAGLHSTAAAAAVAAVHTSVTDGTPRLADEGPLRGVQPYRVHPKTKVQPGSSAFKAVSREQLQRRQRPACAGAVGEGGVDYFKEGYDSLTRPRSSRGPVPIFAKQTARPSSPATSDCPAVLGPGSYYRSGNQPISNTGADLPAGHGHSSSAHGVLEFDKYSSRPGTAPPGARGHEADQLLAGAVAADAEWPGLWGWPAAAGGCFSQTGHLTIAFTRSMVPQQHQGTPSSDEAAASGVAGKQRPSSTDALAYMRRQGPTDLCAPADEQQDSQGDREQKHGSNELSDVIMQQLQRQQLQQQKGRPCSGHQQQQRHHAGIRPATAGAVMVKAATTAGMRCTSPVDCTTKLASSPARQRPSSAYARPSSSRPRPGTGGQQDLKMCSSMGCAPRVKGGAWSTSSRSATAKVLRAMSVSSVIPPASVAVIQPGTELSYDPNHELLGHMHRSPGWRLPPNRTAASKKWAQMAAEAGMQ